MWEADTKVAEMRVVVSSVVSSVVGVRVVGGAMADSTA